MFQLQDLSKLESLLLEKLRAKFPAATVRRRTPLLKTNFQPDFVFLVDKTIWAFEWREHVPYSEFLLGRIVQSKVENPEINLIIVSLQKNVKKLRGFCAKSNIGLWTFSGSKITEEVLSVNTISGSKITEKVLSVNTKQKPPIVRVRPLRPTVQIDRPAARIFVSSKQDIPERGQLKITLEAALNAHSILPDVYLEEETPRSLLDTSNLISRIYPEIKRSNCFVGIVVPVDSVDTEKEIRFAFSKKSGLSHEHILIFVKNATTDDRSPKVTAFIEWLKTKTKYAKYSDPADLYQKLSQRVILHIPEGIRNRATEWSSQT